MIYDIRVYTPNQGCADAVRERFLKEIVPRMPRYGIELVAAFTAADPADDRFTYICRSADQAARDKGWSGLMADPEWLAAKKASEVNGPLIASQAVSVLTPAAAGLLPE